LVYVGEDEARQYAKQCELPIIGCCCPACGNLALQRQRVKRLLADLEIEHPGVKQSMLKALGNVAPRHLLDTRLNPPAELKAAQRDELPLLKGPPQPLPAWERSCSGCPRPPSPSRGEPSARSSAVCWSWSASNGETAPPTSSTSPTRFAISVCST